VSTADSEERGDDMATTDLRGPERHRARWSSSGQFPEHMPGPAGPTDRPARVATQKVARNSGVTGWIGCAIFAARVGRSCFASRGVAGVRPGPNDFCSAASGRRWVQLRFERVLHGYSVVSIVAADPGILGSTPQQIALSDKG
jgi:hypothetical protein